MAGWSSDIYVCVGDVEFWVYIAKYGLIGLDNSLEVDVDEKIVRVNVLFDEAFHLQKCREKVPLVLDMVRPVIAALSMAQSMEDTLLVQMEPFSTQLGNPFRVWTSSLKHHSRQKFLVFFQALLPV